MKLFISCDEAKLICDKTQYNEASLWQKIQLNIRLLHCRVCREYTKKNSRLTKTIKQSGLKTLCKEDKEGLKQKILQEMEK